MKTPALIAAAAAVAVLAAGCGSSSQPATKVTAASTCWAKPGAIDHQSGGRWVPTYTSSGTRHGRGTAKGECGP